MPLQNVNVTLNISKQLKSALSVGVEAAAGRIALYISMIESSGSLYITT